MPWDIVKGHKGCKDGYAVVKPSTGHVAGCHPTKEKARAQQKALYASEASAERDTVSEMENLLPEDGELARKKKPNVAAARRHLRNAMHLHGRYLGLVMGHMQMASDELGEGPEDEPASQEGGEEAGEGAGGGGDSGDGGGAASIMPTIAWGNYLSTASNAVTASGSTNTFTITPNLGNVTVSVLDAPAPEVNAEDVRWEGILGLEGSPTGDKRYLIPGQIEERDLPMPLMVQTINDEGHKGSELGGHIESVSRIPIAEFDDPDYDLSDLPDTTVVIWGNGEFDTSQAGQDAARVIQHGGGVSLDLAVTNAQLLDAETFEPVDMETVDFMSVLMGSDQYITGLSGQIMGATVLPFPAFEDAQIQVITASGSASMISNFGLRLRSNVLTASAAGRAPIAPPRKWFEVPEANVPTPLTVTDDGRVFGHLAVWGQCHTGYKDFCQLPPRSPSDYKFFHLGEIETAEGDRLPVGKITVGTGHAPISYGSVKTLEHYDNTGCVAAFVRAKDGRHGIWLSGAIRSDLPAEKIRDLKANPPSGDWRIEKRSLELQGVLAVPIPGFPVPRIETRLVASGDSEEVEAMVATGFAPNTACPMCGASMPSDGTCPDCGYSAIPEEDGMSRTEMRQKALLQQARAELEWARDGFAYNAEQRRKMAKSGEALPDGSFPIANCKDAENAIHAQGRSGNQARAVAHIKKRVAALGCSGSIFDNYK